MKQPIISMALLIILSTIVGGYLLFGAIHAAETDALDQGWRGFIKAAGGWPLSCAIGSERFLGYCKEYDNGGWSAEPGRDEIEEYLGVPEPSQGEGDEETDQPEQGETEQDEPDTIPVDASWSTTSPPHNSNAQSTCTERHKAIVDPFSEGFAGETRLQNFDRLVDSWFAQNTVIQTFNCNKPDGRCLWVPWHDRSDECSESNLKHYKLDNPTWDRNELVTDEFSQVGIILGNSKREQDFIYYMNTVELLASGKYGSVPVWFVYREGSTITKIGNLDDASDATARTITSLYNAANNDRFSTSTRNRARAMADEMAYDFIKQDFRHECHKTANYGTICHWVGSGADVAHCGFNCNNYAYGGYMGDILKSILQAYANTGDDIFKHYASDVDRQYLAAAEYTGNSLTTAAFSYGWKLENGVMKPVCQRGCLSANDVWNTNRHQWDDADAVRAVTYCRARYYASINGVELTKEGGLWCQEITDSSCYNDDGWCVQLRHDGSNWRNPQGGFYENGLGGNLNFWTKQEDLPKKLDEIGRHYNTGTGTFDSQNCLGVYRPAFAIDLYANAIGLNTNSYGEQTIGTWCT